MIPRVDGSPTRFIADLSTFAKKLLEGRGNRSLVGQIERYQSAMSALHDLDYAKACLEQILEEDKKYGLNAADQSDHEARSLHGLAVTAVIYYARATQTSSGKQNGMPFKRSQMPFEKILGKALLPGHKHIMALRSGGFAHFNHAEGLNKKPWIRETTVMTVKIDGRMSFEFVPIRANYLGADLVLLMQLINRLVPGIEEEARLRAKSLETALNAATDMEKAMLEDESCFDPAKFFATPFAVDAWVGGRPMSTHREPPNCGG